MRVVVGIDASYTNTGFAVFKDGVFQKELSGTFGSKPTEGDHVFRATKIAKEIVSRLDKLKLQGLDEPQVAIEDYSYQSLTNREALGELGGIIKYSLRQAGYGFMTVPITTIRKIITGKGNAKKDVVMLQLYKLHSIDVQQNDLADAAAVGLSADYLCQARDPKVDKSSWTVDVKTAVEGYLKK